MSALIPSFLRGVGAPLVVAGDHVTRIRPPGPDGEPVGPARPRSSRRPHTALTVNLVRDLVQGTPFTYAEIARRTGIAPASICRWKQAGGWTRPASAPVATDTVPSERASARLRARTLAARAQAIAERYLDELERDPAVDPDALGTALAMLKAAKLARMPKKRRRPDEPDRCGPPAPPPPPPAPRPTEPLPSPHREDVQAAWERQHPYWRVKRGRKPKPPGARTVPASPRGGWRLAP